MVGEARAGTANDALHRAYGRYLRLFSAAAVLIHLLLIVFLVAPQGEGFVAQGDEFLVYELPPEVKIPPPPEEIARPATPVIAEQPVEEEITIAETGIAENAPVSEAPPPGPPAEPELGDTYRFVPMTIRPRCAQGCGVEDILRTLPAILRRSGVSCRVTIGIRIDTEGTVTATDLLASSGNLACDRAAEAWAEGTRWTTAYNRDQPVPVWIAQPLEIRTK